MRNTRTNIVMGFKVEFICFIIPRSSPFLESCVILCHLAVLIINTQGRYTLAVFTGHQHGSWARRVWTQHP